MSCRFIRADLGGESQAVKGPGRGVDDDQVHRTLGREQGLLGIAFDNGAMLDRQFRSDTL